METNKYILVNWPEVQSLMDFEWFEKEAVLNTDETSPAASYFIPENRLLDKSDKENFLKIIELHMKSADAVSEYYKIGVDLYFNLNKSPVELLLRCIDLMFESMYTEEGCDWISWFIYDNNYGKNKLEASNDDGLICQTVEDLYDYIQKYRK